MHCIRMLAFSLPINLGYDTLLTALSLPSMDSINSRGTGNAGMASTNDDIHPTSDLAEDDALFPSRPP